MMIKLRYFYESDFATLLEWSGNKSFLLQWASPNFTYPLTREQLIEYLEGSNEPAVSTRLIYTA